MRSAWEHMYADTGSATLFQSYSWNRLAAEHFADRASPYVVLVESDSGYALIPAAVTRSSVALLGEVLFDYRDVLWAGDESLLATAWARLAELHLPLAVTALRGQDVQKRWSAFHPEPYVSAGLVLRSQIGAETFAARHSRLRRTLRQLAEQNVQLRTNRGHATSLVSRIYRQKAQQIDPANNVFTDPVRREFMLAACAMEGSSCEVFTLESSDTIVSAVVTFRDGRVRRFYTIYFDRQWARFSPGTALLFEVTRRSLAEGLDCDYMTGDQPYKRRFSTSSVPLFEVNATPEGIEAACRRWLLERVA